MNRREDIEFVARVRGVRKPLRRKVISSSRNGGRFEAASDEHVTFDGVNFTEVDFRGTQFGYFASRGSIFRGCDFSRVRFRGVFSDVPQSRFIDCRFDRAVLLHMHVWHARFEQCSFRDVKIKRWLTYCGEFVDCTFTGKIEETNFFGRPFGPCAERLAGLRSINEFRGNDFTAAELRDTSFMYGIDLASQHLPQNDRYLLLNQMRTRIERVRFQLSRVESDQLREQCLRVLAVIETNGSEQEWLFIERRPLPGVSRDAMDSVLRLLAEAA